MLIQYMWENYLTSDQIYILIIPVLLYSQKDPKVTHRKKEKNTVCIISILGMSGARGHPHHLSWASSWHAHWWASCQPFRLQLGLKSFRGLLHPFPVPCRGPQVIDKLGLVLYQQPRLCLSSSLASQCLNAGSPGITARGLTHSL